MQPVPAAVIGLPVAVVLRRRRRRTRPARWSRSCPACVHDVAVLVHLELAVEERRCSARGRSRRTGPRPASVALSPVLTLRDARRPSTVSRRRAPRRRPCPSTNVDLRVVERALLHDLRGAQLVAAVHDRHLVGELGEEGRLLHRRVAAADHDDVLVAEEEAVAGRAGRDAAALAACSLGLEAELARRRAGRDDDRVRLVLLVAARGRDP